MSILSLAGRRPSGLGVKGGRLAACPRSPNAVSSDAPDEAHYVEALRLADDPAEAFAAARETVASWPRTRLVTDGEGYLHAECQSRLLGFVDDLELHLRPDRGEIAVRSASRLGYSDLGVNRSRIETLRSALRTEGFVE